MTFKKIGIIAKVTKQETVEVVRNLLEYLKRRDREAYLDIDTAKATDCKPLYQKKEIPELADLIIVLGGDGTLLSVARLTAHHDVPLLAVNIGSLGFLTSTPQDELYTSLDSVFKGDFTVSRRMTIDVKVIAESRIIKEMTLLNDAVINKAALARIIDIQTYIDGHYVTTYKSDGLIISTPTGSTGYSLSAGGPIIYPELNCLILAPICPHTLTNRPIIVHDSAVIDLKLSSKDEDSVVTLDGQKGLPLHYGYVVQVKKSQSVISLIKPPGFDYFDVLRKKLKWGER